MSPAESAIAELLESLWREVAARPDAVAGRRVGVPARVPAERVESESRFSDAFPVLRHFAGAAKLAARSGFARLVEPLARLEPGLRWSQNPSYDESNCSRVLLDGYAYLPLAGPEGPVLCAAPRGGFMLMGPHVIYPAHHHAPREVYLVLTPGSQWQLDRGEWFDVQAGDLLFHDAWQMHGLRTTAQPMLAFAGWVEPGRRQAISFETA